MKKIIAILSILTLLLGLTACGEADLLFAAGPKGGVYLEYGEALADVIESKAGLSVEIQKTKGALSNIQIVDVDPDQIGLAQMDLLNHSWNESGLFKTEGSIDSLRAIGAVYTEMLQLVTADKEIRGIDDLKGKRVSIGLTGSGTYYNATDLLEVAGLKKWDLELEEFSLEEAFEALEKGKLDAAFIFAGLPTPAIADYMEKNELYLAPIEAEYLDTLQRSCDDLTDAAIPAGTYNGQDHAVATLATKTVLFCGADCTEEDIYAITALLFEGGIDHPLAGNTDLAFATEGIDLPFHQGAAKYYAEQNRDVFSK